MLCGWECNGGLSTNHNIRVSNSWLRTYEMEMRLALTCKLTRVWEALHSTTYPHNMCTPGTARWCPSVPTAVYISRQHPDPTKTPVFRLGRSVCSCCQTGYCWTSCFLCRWRSCLERSSCRCHFSTFSVHFPKTFKIASLSTLLSWPCSLN